MAEVASFSGVSLTRGEKHLVKDIDWKLEPGQRWVILGPNGAGKSTLMALLSARLFPTNGELTLLGEHPAEADLKELRSRIGVSADALVRLIPGNERVIDVVLSAAYGVLERGREIFEDVDQARAEELLQAFGVAEFANRMFATLSSGERQRVLSARAVMSDPELLLLDEPAAGMDVGGREHLMRELAKLARDENSPVTVLVTHHVEEIPAGYTHALLIRNGKVLSKGAINEVVNSSNLSQAFGLPLVVEQRDGRFSARAVPLEA